MVVMHVAARTVVVAAIVVADDLVHHVIDHVVERHRVLLRARIGFARSFHRSNIVGDFIVAQDHGKRRAAGIGFFICVLKLPPPLLAAQCSTTSRPASRIRSSSTNACKPACSP